ncbi:recombinase family protein [Anaeromyxobacter oryzisoli]|uniref:recombinase family protein n=1 Tax=Anaeromyxobacter oryzisoli TaxID=2925408 RepID=UPI001F5A2CE3|nr:recombinase family protein [Anaeromyxobacter sp. SG63]
MAAREAPALPRIVELLRVSGQAQADRDTPADQRAALDRLRETHPGVLVERIDCGAIRAVSGAVSFRYRPDLRRLKELSDARAFDELRVRRIDRLTRHDDPRERFVVYGLVSDAGAVIRDASGHVIDPRSEIGEIDWYLQSLFAARERRAIRERTLAGRHRKACEGVPVTTLPYGRTYDRERGTWGIDEVEAAVYRRLFSDVIDGKSLRSIAAALNDAGIPAPRGGAWHPSPIKAMVAAPSAVGRMTSYGVSMTCPAIVDEDTQRRAVEALRRARSYSSGPTAIRHEALLRKVARCGVCGSIIHIAKTGASRHIYYVCGSHRQRDHDPACGRFRQVAPIDAEIKDAIRPVLSDPKALLAAIRRPWMAAEVEKVEDIRAELDALAKREEKLVRLASKGMMSDAVYERQAQEIARLREATTSRLSVAQAAVEAARRATARVQDIEAALRDARANIARDDFAGWRRVVELLFGGADCSVRIMPDGEVKLDGLLPLAPAGGEGVTQLCGDTTSTWS